MAISATHIYSTPGSTPLRTVVDLEGKLRQACKCGDEKTVLELLKDSSIDVNAPNKHGWTALSTACFKGHPNVVRMLIADPRIEINAPGEGGQTPLHVACSMRHIDVVRALVTNSATDRNATNAYGWTPLHLACAINHVDMAHILLENRAHPSSQAELHFIIRNNLLPKAIHEVINSGYHLVFIRYLLGEELHGHQIDVPHEVNASDARGWTHLHLAIAKGRGDVAEYLLTREGIQVNARTKKHFTPLDFAEMMQAENLADQLRTKGGITGEGVRPAPMPEGYESEVTVHNLPNEIWVDGILSNLGKADLANTGFVNRESRERVDAVKASRQRQQRVAREPAEADVKVMKSVQGSYQMLMSKTALFPFTN